MAYGSEKVRCQIVLVRQPPDTTLLRLFVLAKFVVVVECCSGRAPHFADADTAECVSTGGYSLDLLTLGDLAGSFGALILLDNFFRFRDRFR